MSMNPFQPKKQAPSEAILNLRQMDAATCTSLKGYMNEHGECLVKARESPDDPDTLVLETMKYKKPGTGQQTQG